MDSLILVINNIFLFIYYFTEILRNFSDDFLVIDHK